MKTRNNIFLVWLLLMINFNYLSGIARIGIKTGLNYSTFFGKDKYVFHKDASYKYGFTGGLYLRNLLSESVGYQMEFLYSMKGAKLTDENYTLRWEIDYIEFPLMLIKKFEFKKNLNFFLLCGFSLSIHGTDQRARFKAEFLNQSNTHDLDYIGQNDWGFLLGTSIELYLFQLEFRYSVSLNTFDISPEDLGGPYDIKNRVYSLTLGYTIKGDS